MKTSTVIWLVLIAGTVLVTPCIAQQATDYEIARKAYTALKKASVVNGVSLSLGMVSNIEMICIGGFPLEVDNGMNAELNLSHAFFGIARTTTSIFPPIFVSKARRTLSPWRESPEMAASCQRLFAHLDAAQAMTALAPVLCVAGGLMMAYASTHYESTYYYDGNYNYHEATYMSNPGLKTAGWICVGAGLAASFTSAILIGVSKRELKDKMGSLSVTTGQDGVGVQYKLPVSGK